MKSQVSPISAVQKLEVQKFLKRHKEKTLTTKSRTLRQAKSSYQRAKPDLATKLLEEWKPPQREFKSGSVNFYSQNDSLHNRSMGCLDEPLLVSSETGD